MRRNGMAYPACKSCCRAQSMQPNSSPQLPCVFRLTAIEKKHRNDQRAQRQAGADDLPDIAVCIEK